VLAGIDRGRSVHEIEWLATGPQIGLNVQSAGWHITENSNSVHDIDDNEKMSKIAELQKAWLDARDRLNDEMACEPDQDLVEEVGDWQGRIQAQLVRSFVDSY
jgi:hypothetical protein